MTTTPVPDLQARCEQGQQQLMQMQYLEAEATLARAEQIAWDARDFDTLSRLYMPLQEARRQKRQRCGEGIVNLELWAESSTDDLDGRHVVENYPHGQLLVAGHRSYQPALDVRAHAEQHKLFVETFLGAVYFIGGETRAVVIAPLADVALPQFEPASIDELIPRLPPHCLIFHENELSLGGPKRGTTETYAQVMALWERLHTPFLAAADMQVDPIAKIEGYRKAIRVDYACELAHQKLSDTAKDLARAARSASSR